MLRILISFALIGAALWFYFKDGREQQVAGEQQKEMIDTAKAAKAMTEQVSAQMAAQSDAIRDATMASSPESKSESMGANE